MDCHHIPIDSKHIPVSLTICPDLVTLKKVGSIVISYITPNQLYRNQKLTNGQSAYYHLTKLQINTGYEFRVSYPAVIPTDFTIKDLNETSQTVRKLLNIEKFVFWTGLEEEKSFKVTAFRSGVPIEPRLKDLPVTYDVVVEQLHGNVPAGAWKLIVVVLVSSLLVLKYFRQPFINYVSNGNEKLK